MEQVAQWFVWGSAVVLLVGIVLGTIAEAVLGLWDWVVN